MKDIIKKFYYSNFNEEKNIFSDIILTNQPLFIGRIGGSDYNIVQEYFNNKQIYSRPSIYDLTPTLLLRILDKIFSKKNTRRKYSFAIDTVKKFNGYFDFQNQRTNFIKYLNEMITGYMAADHFFVGESTLINKFNEKTFTKNDLGFLKCILKDKVIINYSFIESVLPFLESFKYWGKNKKILIISPFSKSIEYQYNRKDNLIKGYKFPDFKLTTYNTKITYNSKIDTKETLGVQTNNWLEELEKMKKDIALLDFDIALLSCGSYAMPLGKYIKNMGKKSIYIGGVLNVIFNIYGKRYDTSFFNDIVNIEYQITAFENVDIEKIKGGRKTKNESLNAYFGEKK